MLEIVFFSNYKPYLYRVKTFIIEDVIICYKLRK